MKEIMVTDEQYEALLRISELMATQDYRCTAKPLYCVSEIKREWGIDNGYSDNFEWYKDGESFEPNCDTLREETVEWILENREEAKRLFSNAWDRDEFHKDILEDKLEYQKCYYREERVMVKGQVYLTEEAAQDHIDRNHYHYNQPKVYVVSAWRNPEMQLLQDIVFNVQNVGEYHR